ncbi:UNVERIFIED_CONTAM: hypothetical protein PYX00_006412 [Menopon gallinae]|uniref:Uncharacterized protein n=1 Tax=Menopon gallinae TaxID=328185 RepID=A0AAW2HV44_9NEOP
MSVNPSAVSQQTVIRNPLQVVTDIFRAYTKMRQKRLQNLVWDVFCGSLRAVNPFVCETLAIYPVPGYDHPESNMTLLNLSVRHRIFGTTVKDLTHSGQIITSGMFRQYDYGPNKNMDEYGQASPPEYDIKNILVPMHFFTAKNDEAVIREGAERFRNVSDIYVVPNQKFNYMDHIIANNIINLEYEYLVRMIDSYHI